MSRLRDRLHAFSSIYVQEVPVFDSLMGRRVEHLILATIPVGRSRGFVPRHAVRGDIAEGRLKVLTVEDYAPANMIVSMSAVYRSDTPPGPGGRWMIARLQSAEKQVRTKRLDG